MLLAHPDPYPLKKLEKFPQTLTPLTLLRESIPETRTSVELMRVIASPG